MHQRLGISHADILHRHAHEPSGEEARLLPGGEHTGEIIERGLNIAAPDGLMQGGNEVIMPLAVFVIHRHAPLQELSEGGGIKRFPDPGVIERFRRIEQEAPIAIGTGNKGIAGFRCQGQGAFQFLCPVQQLTQRRVVQPLEDQHLCPAEQCGIKCEAGVLRRRAHQRHCAAFHKGQEAILLGAVETVDFVHKQQGALARLCRPVCRGEGFFEVGHPAEYSRDAFKPHAHAIGQQAGDRGLSRARRPPQDHAGQTARRDHAAYRSLWPGQMILPDHLIERGRAQPVCQRRIGTHYIWGC